jgi:general stress protein CsbA
MEVIMLTANTKERRPLDLCNLVVGMGLFISPWLLGFAGSSGPARNAWIVAVALVVISFAEIAAFAEWEEWVSLLLGVWLMAAPWTLGFTGDHNAFWIHLVFGALMAAVSFWAIWDYRHEPHATA